MRNNLFLHIRIIMSTTIYIVCALSGVLSGALCGVLCGALLGALQSTRQYTTKQFYFYAIS